MDVKLGVTLIKEHKIITLNHMCNLSWQTNDLGWLNYQVGLVELSGLALSPTKTITQKMPEVIDIEGTATKNIIKVRCFVVQLSKFLHDFINILLSCGIVSYFSLHKVHFSNLGMLCFHDFMFFLSLFCLPQPFVWVGLLVQDFEELQGLEPVCSLCCWALAPFHQYMFFLWLKN